MLIFDGDRLEISDFESVEDVVNRVAARLRSIPRYLYFAPDLPPIEELRSRAVEVRVEDVFASITTWPSYSFGEMYRANQQYVEALGLSIEEDVLYPFIAFNSALAGAGRDMVTTFLLVLETELNQYFAAPPAVERIWDERDAIRSKFTALVQENLKRVERGDALRRDLTRASGVESTDLELRKRRFTASMASTLRSLSELFDRAVLSESAPFISYQNTTKVFTEASIPKEWVAESEDFVVRTREAEAPLTVTVEDGFVRVSGSVTSREDRGSLLTSVFQAFRLEGEVDVEDTSVTTVYYYPHFSLSAYTFRDMVMNDPVFSAIVQSDESSRASRVLGIYLRSGTRTALVVPKVASIEDPDLRGKDVVGAFASGSSYVRVRVQGPSVDDCSQFRDVFSRLLSVYLKKAPSVRKAYLRFIPNFDAYEEKQTPLPPQRKLKLKDYAPEVFLRGYPPLCPHQPTIVSDAEAKEAEEKGQEVMRYPKTENEGFIPRNYVCNHKKAVYPGLRTNPLSNSDTVPFLPCCYLVDQKTRGGSAYRAYFYGKPLKEQGISIQQNIIRTNKFVGRDMYGYLPEDATQVLRSIDPDVRYEFVRKGVLPGNSSFLLCVLEALHERTGILDIRDPEELVRYVEEVRAELARKPVLAKQHLYDESTENIEKRIANPDKYLDPLLFTQLLEEYYSCNIFLFERKGETTQLVVPRHTDAYLQRSRRGGPCVLIYVHRGGPSERALGVRCELIVRWKMSGARDQEYSFPYESKVASGVRTLFAAITRAQHLNDPVAQPPLPKLSYTAQTIDAYGKCIALHHDSGTVLVPPMEPVDLPVTASVRRMRVRDAQRVLRPEFQVLNAKQRVIAVGAGRLLIPTVPGAALRVPVRETNNVYVLGEEEDEKGEKSNSVLTEFANTRRRARYVLEYAYWLFSRQIANVAGQINAVEEISRFGEERVLVDPAVQYGSTQQAFSLSPEVNGGIVRDEKLVLASVEIAKRILFALRLKLRRESAVLREYYSKETIPGFFSDVSDYNARPSEVIIQGTAPLEAWIESRERSNKASSAVQPYEQIPYYFHNPLVSSQYFLAANFASLTNALATSEHWFAAGFYMPQQFEGEHPSFTLFVYENPASIRAYAVKGGETPDRHRVLGYKVRGRPRFTVLLPLGAR